MARRLPGAVSGVAAGRGAAARGERAAEPGSGLAECSRPPWGTGVLSQSGGGAGDPRSSARPDADPPRIRAERTRPPGVWGIRSRAEWSTPSIGTLGPSARALGVLAMSGTDKEDVLVAECGPWRPGETTPPSLALRLAALCPVSGHWRGRPFFSGLTYFCRMPKKMFHEGFSADNEEVDSRGARS